MKQTVKSYLDTFVVAGDVQTALPTGNLVGSGTTMNITNGHIGVVSKDSESMVRGYDVYIQNTDTYPGVEKVAVVQGTPNSANTTNWNPFGFGNPVVVQSDTIDGGKIRSVSTTYPNYGSPNAIVVTGVANAVSNAPYGVRLALRGSRKHNEYGQVLDDNIASNFTTPDYTALGYTAAQAKSHLLHNVLGKLASFSRLYQTNRSSGNKNFVVFGVNLAGGGGITGQALGTIADGTSFTWATVNGTNLTFTATPAFVQAMSKVISATALTATSEIVPINVANPIASTNIIDSFIVVAIDEIVPVAFTDITTVRERIVFSFADQFRVSLPTLVEASPVREPLNSGFLLWLRWRANAALRNSQQNQPHGDFFPEVPYYFSNGRDALYTVTDIGFYNDQQTIATTNITELHTLMLFPATATNLTDDANTLAGSDYTYATTNSTLIADVETIFGDWLQSARAVNPFALGGLCTSTTYFF